jgi:hypothetical protein
MPAHGGAYSIGHPNARIKPQNMLDTNVRMPCNMSWRSVAFLELFWYDK